MAGDGLLVAKRCPNAQCILWIKKCLRIFDARGRAWATRGGRYTVCNPGIFLLFFTLFNNFVLFFNALGLMAANQGVFFVIILQFWVIILQYGLILRGRGIY